MTVAVGVVGAVIAVGAMYFAASPADWLARVALITGGAMPATLLWLVLGCSLKTLIARLARPAQVAAGVALGALAGLYACGTLAVLALWVARRSVVLATLGGAVVHGLTVWLLG